MGSLTNRAGGAGGLAGWPSAVWGSSDPWGVAKIIKEPPIAGSSTGSPRVLGLG